MPSPIISDDEMQRIRDDVPFYCVDFGENVSKILAEKDADVMDKTMMLVNMVVNHRSFDRCLQTSGGVRSLPIIFGVVADLLSRLEIERTRNDLYISYLNLLKEAYSMITTRSEK